MHQDPQHAATRPKIGHDRPALSADRRRAEAFRRTANGLDMGYMRTMRAAVKVLCIVTAMLLGVLSPSAASAATHCATSPETAITQAQPAGALHDMDHRSDRHLMKDCCLAVCSLQAGIPPVQPSGPPAAVVRDVTFLDLSAPLKGHPVPPDFEPPRTLA
ncbi:hypothetical protein Mame_04481 (plasmid) [Martelella mediterranea DSM 17316]|uniref:DUF2946 domain-containing protein n=2 Tax=Martelella mediterranea TaxID=293089 RepID=A0A1U9Z7S5_9HYPH|nr:hypothetical protein Mame_04481 [Martelella mediterranea DSM 17316]